MMLMVLLSEVQVYFNPKSFYANFPTAEEQKWSWARRTEEEVGEKEKKLGARRVLALHK